MREKKKCSGRRAWPGRLGHDRARKGAMTRRSWATTQPRGPTTRPARAREGLAAGGECRDTMFCIVAEGQTLGRDTMRQGCDTTCDTAGRARDTARDTD